MPSPCEACNDLHGKELPHKRAQQVRIVSVDPWNFLDANLANLGARSTEAAALHDEVTAENSAGAVRSQTERAG